MTGFQFQEPECNAELNHIDGEQTDIDSRAEEVDSAIIDTFEDVRIRMEAALPNLRTLWDVDNGIVIMLLRFLENAESFVSFFPLIMFVESLKRKFAEKEGFSTPEPSRETLLLFTWWYRYIQFI